MIDKWTMRIFVGLILLVFVVSVFAHVCSYWQPAFQLNNEYELYRTFEYVALATIVVTFVISMFLFDVLRIPKFSKLESLLIAVLICYMVCCFYQSKGLIRFDQNGWAIQGKRKSFPIKANEAIPAMWSVVKSATALCITFTGSLLFGLLIKLFRSDELKPNSDEAREPA